MSHPLDAVVIDAPGTHASSVIWLHGLGADGHDFEPVVPGLGLSRGHGVRFVFPHAPRQPITINGGLIMPAWYDVRDVDLRRTEDAVGIRRSATRINQFIEREMSLGVATHRILLAGFSQGGAIALYCGLRYPQALAGILALSTYLPLSDELAREASGANRATPIFMAHGAADPLIPLYQGKASATRLTNLGYTVEWRDYPMPHAVCPAEIRDIGDWIKARLID